MSSQLAVENTVFKLIHRDNAYSNNPITGDGAGIWATGVPDIFFPILNQTGYGNAPSSALSFDE